LLEAHGREIAGSTTCEQRSVMLGDAVIEQEAHIAPGRRQIHREIGIAEHRRHGDVAAFQPLLGAFEIHERARPSVTGRLFGGTARPRLTYSFENLTI